MAEIEKTVEEGFDALAGHVIGAHGVQGALKVRVATKTATALISPGSGVSRRPVDVRLKREGEPRLVADTIVQLKETVSGSSVYIARLGAVRDRTQAETLVGMAIYAPSSRRAPLQEDEYFTDELVGLDVVGDRGQKYGKISAVHSQPANDVYETDQGALIPAVKAFVSKIDVPGGRVIVYEVPGLRPDEAEEIRSEGEMPHGESEA